MPKRRLRKLYHGTSISTKSHIRKGCAQSNQVQLSQDADNSFEDSSISAPTATNSSANSKCGILVRSEILELNLIEVPDPDQEEARCYKHASYDFRLGHEYILLDHSNDHKQIEISSCKGSGILTIPPYGCVIISTYESVNLPKNVAGRFNLRIAYALEGLIVQMGTQVEPGYKGQLIALLQNITGQYRSFKYRDSDSRPLTIEFSYTTQDTDAPENKKKTMRDFIPTNVARYGLDFTLNKLKESNELLDKVTKQYNTKSQAIVIGVFVVILVGAMSIIAPFFLNKFAYDKGYYPLATADMMANIKYGKNSADKDDELVKKVLLKLKVRDISTTNSPEIEYAYKLVKLKKLRSSLVCDPKKANDLRLVDDEISQLIEIIRK